MMSNLTLPSDRPPCGFSGELCIESSSTCKCIINIIIDIIIILIIIIVIYNIYGSVGQSKERFNKFHLNEALDKYISRFMLNETIELAFVMF